MCYPEGRGISFSVAYVRGDDEMASPEPPSPEGGVSCNLNLQSFGVTFLAHGVVAPHAAQGDADIRGDEGLPASPNCRRR